MGRVRQGTSCAVVIWIFHFQSPGACSADWRENGQPVAPSTVSQGQVFGASDGAGGAFLTWVLPRPNRGHFVQRITGNGNVAPGWALEGLNISTMNEAPAIVSDGNGGAYAAATYDHFGSSSPSLVFQKVSAFGSVADGWPAEGIIFRERLSSGSLAGGPLNEINRPSGNTQVALCLNPETNDLLLSRTAISTGAEKVHATQFHPTGVPKLGWEQGGLFMNSLFGTEWRSAIAPDGGGGVFVSYVRRGDPSRLYLNHLGPHGESNHWMAPCSTNVNLDAPAMVSDSDGGIFLFWEDRRLGPEARVFCQRILMDDMFAPGWPDSGRILCSRPTAAGGRRTLGTTNSLPVSSVAADGTGGAFIVWTDYRDSSRTGEGDIYAQHVLPSGELAVGWPVDGLPVCTVAGDQQRPTVVADGEGGILVAWEDSRSGDTDVYVQHLTGGGSISEDWLTEGVVACGAPGPQHDPVVVSGADGSAIVAWIDERDSVAQVYAARVAPSEKVPVLASLVSAEAQFDRVLVIWELAGLEHDVPVSIFRREPDGPWILTGSANTDFHDRIEFVDRSVVPGRDYDYAIAWGDLFRPILATLASVIVPRIPEFALRDPTPNPGAGDLTIDFSLPDARSCTIELFDVTGRRVMEREIGNPEAGSNAFVLRRGSLRAGIYLVRLSQGLRQAVARVCWIR